VLAGVSASEEPGSIDVFVTLHDQTGAAWQTYGHNRKVFRSYTWMRAVDLPAAPVAFSLFAHSGGSTATVSDMRLLVLPGDESGLRSASALGATPVATPGPTTIVSLSLPAPPGPIDRVVLQNSAVIASNVATTTTPVSLEHVEHDEVEVRYDSHD